MKGIPAQRKISEKAINKAVSAILDSAGKDTKKDLESITRTWNHKPRFIIRKSVRFMDAYVTVTTDDKIFHFLNEGTSKRYALMSKDWRSKTSPGMKASKAGRGRVLYIGKRKPWKRSRKRWPRPGIKARRWIPDVQRNNSKNMSKRLIMKLKGNLII